MMHPFDVLAPEYSHVWANAQTLPGRQSDVDRAAFLLLDDPHLRAFEATQKATGVPLLWHAPVLFREADASLLVYLGNGDPLNRPTTDVPRGRGPFATYEAGAEDALNYDHVTEVDFWTIERMLYEGELWNGFGYRNKGVLSPYLVGGTTMQQAGKYVADGRWDPHAMDEQLGTIPIAKRIIELHPMFTLPNKPDGTGYPETPAILPQPAPDGLGGEHDTAWIQSALNQLGASPQLTVDGSYGRRTRNAVRSFQSFHDLEVDGLAGPLTIEALSAGLSHLA